jgi:transketolase
MVKEKMTERLKKLAALIRYYTLIMTTEAGSGHPPSSLSATELMVCLLFGGIFRFYVKHPKFSNNDRLIFSKGHASPLFYALWAAAGALSEKDLLTYRKFGSPLEGHPTVAFPYTEAATGSLGQGLSIGVGMALNAKNLDKLPYRTYVLLGDSEKVKEVSYGQRLYF